MPVRGAKPSPVSLRAIKGGKIPANVPQPPPESIPEPKWSDVLGAKTAASRDAHSEWNRIVPRLDDLGLLSGLDRSIVVDYCTCWARLLGCERAITEGGMSTDCKMYTAKNPAITAANQYRTALKTYISELGLSPSSRMRLALPGDDDPNDFNLD